MQQARWGDVVVQEPCERSAGTQHMQWHSQRCLQREQRRKRGWSGEEGKMFRANSGRCRNFQILRIG